MKTNISENLYDFASFQAGDLRGHMQSNIWENRGRLWWTESPPKSAQKSTRESRSAQKRALESKTTLLSAQKSAEMSGFAQRSAHMRSFTQKRALAQSRPRRSI